MYLIELSTGVPADTGQNIVPNLATRYYMEMTYLSMFTGALTEVKQYIRQTQQQLSPQSPAHLQGRYEMLNAYHVSFYDSNLNLDFLPTGYYAIRLITSETMEQTNLIVLK